MLSPRFWGSLAGTAVVLVLLAVAALPFVVGRAGAPAGQFQEVLAAVPDPAGAPAIPTPPARPRSRERLVPPDRGVYFGVSNDDLVSGRRTIASWSREHAARPRIVNGYQQWLSGERRFRPDWADGIADQGGVPMITWEPWSAPLGERHTAEQPDISLARIAAGDHDPYIRTWAAAIAAHRRPILIRLAHEMNGFWYPWGVTVNGNSPDDYVAAWRHVHDLFTAAGASNVSWVWSVNNLEGEQTDVNAIRSFYPGARYVDWVSTSGFNWGEAHSWSSWRTADPLYLDTYDALAAFEKPIMISEIGTTSVGGTAPGWIVQTLRRLRARYPLLRAVVWYDDIDGAGLDFRLRGETRTSVGDSGVGASGWFRDLTVRPAA